MCSDLQYDTVVVSGLGLTCDASFSYADSGSVFNFWPDSPAAGMAYSWVIDGTSYTSQFVSHTFTSSGSKSACLLVSNSNTGCTDSSCVTLQVNIGGGVICDASFTTTNVNKTYTFTPSYPEATATYIWDFGDGNSSTSSLPTHTYTTNGTYSVSVARVVPSQCVDSSFVTIVVTGTPPPTSGIISGVISMGTPAADYGVVFLIGHDSASGTLSVIDTTIIDSLGMYYFANVAYGTYLVKAALSPASVNYNSFIPSYHAVTAIGGVALWSNATDVVLNQPYLNNISINLVSGANNGGPGFIGGLVSQGANKVGDPISDINVMVTDKFGTPIAYAYSDHTGAFNVSNLELGTYIVYPEVAGKVTNPITIILTAAQNGTDKIRVTVNTSTVDASIATGIISKSFTDVQVYPNPVIDVLKIDLGNMLSGNVLIQVMDVTGKLISSNTVNSTGLVQINTSNYLEGVYILSIQNKGENAVYKFVK
jgi:PKD repeat protein